MSVYRSADGRYTAYRLTRRTNYGDRNGRKRGTAVTGWVLVDAQSGTSCRCATLRPENSFILGIYPE